MAENEVKQVIQQLDSLKANHLSQAPQLLSRAKLGLLHLNALIPSEDTKPQHLQLATAVLEHGALISIKLKDTDSFTRYYQQLQPFYSLPQEGRRSRASNQGKVTGLYLLLLLSVGDYAGFHTVLEGLEVSGGKDHIDRDEFIQYPVRLEQALMEGSYDKVWVETKGERVPSEEFAVFSEVSISKAMLVQPQSLTYSCRSSSTRSDPKSLPAQSAPTHLSPSRTQRTCYSSTRRAPWCNSRSLAAGWQRMDGYTSRSRRRRCARRRRMS